VDKSVKFVDNPLELCKSLLIFLLFIPITYEIIHYCHSPVPILYTVVCLVDNLSTRHTTALAAHLGVLYNETKSFFATLSTFPLLLLLLKVIFLILLRRRIIVYRNCGQVDKLLFCDRCVCVFA
jgi:hypothetical protein